MLKKFLTLSLPLLALVFTNCKNDEPGNTPPPPKPDIPEITHDGYVVYAYNNTGWETLNLYMWGDKQDLNGSWPGMKPTGSTMINGYEFLYYDMGKANTGLTENLIFNCTSQQLPDFGFTINKDIYLEVTANYVARIDPTTFVPSTPLPNNGTAVTDMVVYEANPRFFGTNNCLNGLAGNLQRISDLGCNVLWIMPICEPSTSSQAIGSPYSIKNYGVINPKYGTTDDLKQLVSSAHSLGIKVVLDWVPNHTGWDNPWVTQHPDWFLQENGKIVSPPGTGWNDVAQLNYENPAVGEAMSEVIKYWVNLADLDGIRFDYADSPYITPSFWKEIATQLRTIKSDFILLAESSNYVFYNYGFDMIYDWNSAPTISAGFKNSKAEEIVTEAQKAISKVPEGDSILRYVFNHDVMSENAIDKYFGSINALPAAYVCASMLNGTPLIYSGMDATGLSGTQSFMNYKQLTFSSALTPVYNSINNAFKATTEVRAGALSNYSTNNVVCFTRTLEDNILFVVVNTSSSSNNFTTPSTVKGINFDNLIEGGTESLGETIALEPYGYKILMK